MFLFGLGLVILLVAWLPMVLHAAPLSVPIICVAIGWGLERAGLLPLRLESFYAGSLGEHLTEAVVLIALMGAGLRLDRRFSLRRWESTWRLLFIAMPLTIGVMALLAYGILGWPWAVALLLGAALAPTDPVLAGDVQTGPPGKGEHGEVRFGLTAEAGLNDGLAFPFVTLAVLALQHGTLGPADWLHWAVADAGLELLGGGLLGWAGGRVMGWAMFHVPVLRLSDTGDGLVAVGVTLMAYATAQALGCNGFITVFVAAATIRRSAPVGEFHHAMSEFSEQVERVLVMLILVAFGWALGAGLLAPLSWAGAGVALALILVVRPATAMLGFVGARLHWESRLMMGFFGIRGIGTLFYLQWAFRRADFPQSRELAAVAGFAILVSVLLHGTTATPLMRLADAILKRQRRAAGLDPAPWSRNDR